MGYRSDEFFQGIFESEKQDILVAEEAGKVLGFSHLMILKQKEVACLKPQTAVYIQDLDVLESERNKGIGTLLMNASKEYGKKHGADFIRTQVFPQNTDGMRFYERNGFCEMMKTIECQF
ncbi:GNAT family N-acetyltransferase [Sellimonas caecigallum]|uniref:GNAT family N-acetyltransferase n=1 Tax=Sellimonas caecigallum TaxID=2592333 RepID=UPI0013021348